IFSFLFSFALHVFFPLSLYLIQQLSLSLSLSLSSFIFFYKEKAWTKTLMEWKVERRIGLRWIKEHYLNSKNKE
ncbi:hypothetical protein ACMBCM_09160, partial [Spiroplasma sp. K1]